MKNTKIFSRCKGLLKFISFLKLYIKKRDSRTFDDNHPTVSFYLIAQTCELSQNHCAVILNPNFLISFNVPSAVSRSYAFSTSGSSS